MLSEEDLAPLRVNSGHENTSAKVEIQCTHGNQQREETSLLLCIKNKRYQALPCTQRLIARGQGGEPSHMQRPHGKENKESRGLAARNKVMAAPLEMC